jgi:hypothetical protein
MPVVFLWINLAMLMATSPSLEDLDAGTLLLREFTSCPKESDSLELQP